MIMDKDILYIITTKKNKKIQTIIDDINDEYDEFGNNLYPIIFVANDGEIGVINGSYDGIKKDMYLIIVTDNKEFDDKLRGFLKEICDNKYMICAIMHKSGLIRGQKDDIKNISQEKSLNLNLSYEHSTVGPIRDAIEIIEGLRMNNTIDDEVLKKLEGIIRYEPKYYNMSLEIKILLWKMLYNYFSCKYEYEKTRELIDNELKNYVDNCEKELPEWSCFNKNEYNENGIEHLFKRMFADESI